jgi:hypothetical protein
MRSPVGFATLAVVGAPIACGCNDQDKTMCAKTVETEFRVFLDAISECFIEQNFNAWRACVFLPFSMITAAGPVELTDTDALRENFDLYLQAGAAMRLTKIYRTFLNLEECTDGAWMGTYETNLLSGAVRAAPPYTSTVLMLRTSKGFRATSILNARGHHDWTVKMPVRSKECVT